jgi:hypothetical protein
LEHLFDCCHHKLPGGMATAMAYRDRVSDEQPDPEDEARERYNREARAKAERLQQTGGWPPDPINNPDHPLYQSPDQRES